MYGESVDVNPEDVEEVESNPDYTVYQANPRSNPGEVLTKVVYNNPGDGTTLPEDFMQSTSATQTMQETGMDDGSGIETMEEDLPLGMPLEERDSGVASLYGGRSNPPSTGSSVISWRNLRLQSAINNEKQIKGRVFGTGAQVVRKLTNFRGLIGARANKDESVRPYEKCFTKQPRENWADYIRNMNALDISAELSCRGRSPKINYQYMVS